MAELPELLTYDDFFDIEKINEPLRVLNADLETKDTTLSALSTAVASKADAAATVSALATKVDKRQGGLDAPDLAADLVKYIRRGTHTIFNDMIPVGCRSGHGINGTNQSNGTDIWHNSQIKIPIAYRCADVGLAFRNYFNGEAPGSNTITIKATINRGLNIWADVCFRGKTTWTLDPGEVITSDPVGLDFAAGEVMIVRTLVSGITAGQKWSFEYTTRSGDGEGVIKGTGAVNDMTKSGATFTPSTEGAYGPFAVLAARTSPLRPTVVGLVGDSILNGLGETAPETDLGFAIRALGTTYPHIRVDRSGSTGLAFLTANGTSGSQKRMLLLSAATHVLCEFGINDLNTAGQSFETVKATLLELWNRIAIRGAKVYQSTITPMTTSTDSWATTGNQTVKSWEAERVLLNEWIRTTPAPLSGYFELADVAETSRNSGIWKVGLTADGTHPNAAGHAALASALDITKFAQPA